MSKRVANEYVGRMEYESPLSGIELTDGRMLLVLTLAGGAILLFSALQSPAVGQFWAGVGTQCDSIECAAAVGAAGGIQSGVWGGAVGSVVGPAGSATGFAAGVATGTAVSM